VFFFQVPIRVAILENQPVLEWSLMCGIF